MKFVCLACETYMTLEKVEKPEEGSLGVFFVCPSCHARFSMVTNAGETNMMNVLGLKLGARAESADPTLSSLADKIQKVKPVGATGVSSGGEKTTSGCPFSAMVAEMGLTGSGNTPTNWIWNRRGEFGGTTPGTPSLPYPKRGGRTSRRIPPTRIPRIPSSHPRTTSPAPRVKETGGAGGRV
ncbi:MAG: hypothetical protein NNA23_13575, partial [Nitrospira sp.]|nr:hypothetical protein [Nitrospira sp.]